MKALIFGSIGSVVETSELQREAFNAAFAHHGLDWHWDRDTYRSMLAGSGGKTRIADYASQMQVAVDAGDIHATKTRFFGAFLKDRAIPLRAGVLESLRVARELGLKMAFASTTAATTVDAILRSQNGVLADYFDVATSADDGFAQKPAPDVYQSLCERFEIPPQEALVVEDNAPGLQAAKSAGTRVIAFLGANTLDHSVETADWAARNDIFPVVLGALTAQERKAG